MINSLVATLFAYKMAVLPTPPVEIFKTFKDICLDFIWDGRRPKIKFETLCTPKSHGGLGLVNLEMRNLAQKLHWTFGKMQQKVGLSLKKN